MITTPITAEIVREFLNYDQDTGVLTWRPRAEHWFATHNAFATWNTRYAGTVAGRVNDHGYRMIAVFHHLYRAHRIIWLYMTGELPKEIDHIDRDRLNNAWKNLRVVSRAVNSQNHTMQSNNTSGVTGVSWSTRDRVWRVMIGGKYIGCSKDFDEAVAIRLEAVTAWGYHPNHGEPKKETAPSAER